MLEGPMTDDIGRISTAAWEMEVPRVVTPDSPLLVVPTVHPRGDRRVVRCAQVALDAGFRVHFVWLGNGEPSGHWGVRETLFRPPSSRRERIALISDVSRAARSLDASVWHIHDFYMLGSARRWSRKAGKRVLYDVHEYYGIYYSGLLPLPTRVRPLIARAIDRYQVRAAKRLGAANVVSERMAHTFRAGGVPVAVSPNYPLLEHVRRAPEIPFSERRWDVLHVGTLTPEYGTERLIALAKRSLERNLQFRFRAVARFPSAGYEEIFHKLLANAGALPNFELLPSRPTHEMPLVLGQAGFGLSLLNPGGQRDLAVASKLYEHTVIGLVNVVTNRPAQRQFVDNVGVGVVSESDSVDEILDGMLLRAEEIEETAAALDSARQLARSAMTWETGVAPALGSLLRGLLADE